MTPATAVPSPAIPPLHYAVVGGRPVGYRPLLPQDQAALHEGFGRLSARSRYQRFFRSVRDLTPDELAWLTEVDQVNHLAIGAQDLAGEAPVGIAVARCVRLADRPDAAEPALTVVDSHQRRGIGTWLMRVLADAARRRGIRSFEGHVFADNEPMIAILRRYDVRFELDGGGVYRFVAPLTDARRARPAPTAAAPLPLAAWA
ncbi:MAG TPA: GNAT family N-acetyltransferase [Pelomicrobium sp.]|nr:GNAT family N-acetyltransferase [Pelomicrobium sp.]